MKTLGAAVVILGVAVPIAVYAWAGTLNHPTISSGKGATPESTGAVLKLLQTKCGFVKGEFVNAYQTMDFSGSPSVIPELLQLLNAARVDAGLGATHLIQTNVTFRIEQSGWSSDMRTRVIVNLDYPHPDRVGLGKPLGLDLEPAATAAPAPTNPATRTAEPTVHGDGKPAPQP